MYFIVICMKLYIVASLYGVLMAVAWEVQVSAFSPATDFRQYHTTLRMSSANRNCSVKDLIMTWSGYGIKAFY